MEGKARTSIWQEVVFPPRTRIKLLVAAGLLAFVGAVMIWAWIDSYQSWPFSMRLVKTMTETFVAFIGVCCSRLFHYMEGVGALVLAPIMFLPISPFQEWPLRILMALISLAVAYLLLWDKDVRAHRLELTKYWDKR